METTLSKKPIRARVLVVDDEPSIRELFVHRIGSLGHDVITVSQGQDALEHARTGTFDVVFCDIIMSRMDGFEVLSGLQKTHANTPIVMMTGSPAVKYEIEARILGAFAFLRKPFDFDAVTGLISLALARKTGESNED